MVISDLLAIAHALRINIFRSFHLTECCGYLAELQNAHFHVIGKVSAVCSGISTQLFLVKLLEIIQSLLSRVAQNTVGIALECCQIIKGRRIFLLFFSLHRSDTSIFSNAGFGHRLSNGFVLLLFSFSIKTHVKFHRVEGLRNKGRNFGLPLDNQGQRGRDYATDVQLCTIQQREQPGCIDAYQPVGFRTAESGLVKAIIFGAILQIQKSFPNCFVLHGGDPKPLHRLLAFRQIIDCSENQLTLPTSITSVDDFCNIAAMHQLF